jgi:hypothetical protein
MSRDIQGISLLAKGIVTLKESGQRKDKYCKMNEPEGH